jgi:tetratricopeptide (TPR) repeat protein
MTRWMGWPGGKRSYDRARVLKQATLAVGKRRYAKALALYQQVLAHEPRNTDLHRRLAPLLARTGKPEEAWASYQRGAEALVRKGFVEQAIGVYREACDRLPRAPEAWLALADLEVERSRPRDAVQTLLAGRRRFRSRRDRNHAVRLLKRARKIDPQDFPSTFDLAGLAARAGLRAHALRMLDEIAPSCSRRQLRRLRGRQLAIAPGPRALWRYLRALLGAERPQRARRRLVA